MENPRTWGPIAKSVNYSQSREPKEILDELITRELVPGNNEELYWEMLGAISEAVVESEQEIEQHVCSSSIGTKVSNKINLILVKL